VLNENMTTREAAAYLRVSESLLRQSRCTGRKTTARTTIRTEGPPWVKCGALVRYRRADLDAWLDRHLVVPDVLVESPSTDVPEKNPAIVDRPITDVAPDVLVESPTTGGL
jgi:hypothetical protein